MKQINSATTISPEEPNSGIGMPRGEHGLATRVNSTVLPHPTPRLTQSLSPREIQEHRSRIGFEVEIVLSGYWQTFPAKEIKAGIIADWADELNDWAIEQIVWGLRKWRTENPDKRPNPSHISAILKDARGRKLASVRPALAEPERERVSAEEASRIIERAGFTVRRVTEA